MNELQDWIHQRSHPVLIDSRALLRMGYYEPGGGLRRASITDADELAADRPHA